ncbi:MAG: helix-turn-helix transcriptional regulator [Candidatus Melainabacteria bacterium]|nr:helix-turn-helix transcriptional regulator [Candidatus Melainabacteria bacterium]
MSKQIKSNLAYLRATRGRISQRTISEATGIGQKTLSALETGASKGIEFNTMVRLCEFFKCTPNDLFTIEDEPDTTPPSLESLAKADALIGIALQNAMQAPKQTSQEIWAEFDALRARLQASKPPAERHQ